MSNVFILADFASDKATKTTAELATGQRESAALPLLYWLALAKVRR